MMGMVWKIALVCVFSSNCLAQDCKDTELFERVSQLCSYFEKTYTKMPTALPTLVPTSDPSEPPSVPPTFAPTMLPSLAPTMAPTLAPSELVAPAGGVGSASTSKSCVSNEIELKSALRQAVDGSIICLEKDIAVTEIIRIDATTTDSMNITIDGKGFELRSSYDGRVLLISLERELNGRVRLGYVLLKNLAVTGGCCVDKGGGILTESNVDFMNVEVAFNNATSAPSRNVFSKIGAIRYCQRRGPCPQPGWGGPGKWECNFPCPFVPQL